ncbi:MAG: hypothetical protein AAGD92_11680 [Pseudomonadota bacterium]
MGRLREVHEQLKENRAVIPLWRPAGLEISASGNLRYDFSIRLWKIVFHGSSGLQEIMVNNFLIPFIPKITMQDIHEEKHVGHTGAF